MKKVLSIALLAGTFAFADMFAGINYISGTGKVHISTSSYYGYTLSDTDDMSTSGLKFYVGKGHWYGFYQTGTISPDSKYLSDHDYNAFGVGYRFDSKYTQYNMAKIGWYWNIDVGYDEVKASPKKTILDSKKTGILFNFGIGGNFALASFDKLSLNIGLGYELHAVKDDTSDSLSSDDSGTWNFSSFVFTTGLKYDF